MLKFFEMGLMITIFILSINAFIGVFGDGPLAVVGYAPPGVEGVDITQTDVNDMLTAGSAIAKSGAPYTESPGFLDMIFPGFTPVASSVGNLVAGYATVLYAILPVELHPVIVLVTVILTFIQIVTLLWLILTVASVIRGGGAG